MLEYVDGKPSVVPAFEEVKTAAVDQIKLMRAYDATLRQAQETVTKLKKLVADGKTFADACKQLKIKTETLPAFQVADEKPKLPAAQRIQTASIPMPIGAVSDLIPTEKGALVFHLKDRQPPDPATAEKDKAAWVQRVQSQNRQALFQAWAVHLIREHQVDFGRLRSQPVQEEPAATP